MNYRTVILILCLCWAGNSFGQINTFKSIFNDGREDKTYIKKSFNDTCWRKLLGYYQKDRKSKRLAVISEFKKVRAASTWHGHSNVYFVNTNGKIVYRILIDMPDELPVKFDRSGFYFKSDNSLVQVPFKIVDQHLICGGPNGCLEVLYN